MSPIVNGKYLDWDDECGMPKPIELDMVNHPTHYQLPGGLEAIDILEAATKDLKGSEATNTFNALKYLLRWKNKNGLEDLKKSRWYLDRMITEIETKEAMVRDELSKYAE